MTSRPSCRRGGRAGVSRRVPAGAAGCRTGEQPSQRTGEQRHPEGHHHLPLRFPDGRGVGDIDVGEQHQAHDETEPGRGGEGRGDQPRHLGGVHPQLHQQAGPDAKDEEHGEASGQIAVRRGEAVGTVAAEVRGERIGEPAGHPRIQGTERDDRDNEGQDGDPDPQRAGRGPNGTQCTLRTLHDSLSVVRIVVEQLDDQQLHIHLISEIRSLHGRRLPRTHRQAHP